MLIKSNKKPLSAFAVRGDNHIFGNESVVTVPLASSSSKGILEKEMPLEVFSKPGKSVSLVGTPSPVPTVGSTVAVIATVEPRPGTFVGTLAESNGGFEKCVGFGVADGFGVDVWLKGGNGSVAVDVGFGVFVGAGVFKSGVGFE